MLVDQQVAPDPAEVTWINPDIDRQRTYKVLTGVPGKTGVIYTLDRETGRFLWARPTILQNVVGDIDGRTGRVTVNPATVPTEYGTPMLVCPAASGGANYQSGAYSPLTQTMYFPAQNTCTNFQALPADQRNVYGMANRGFIAPDAGDNLGVIHAINAVTGKSEWSFAQRAGMQSLMTTGGGLLFAGDSHGRFRAMDDRTGEILWEVNLGSPVTGYPATFEVDGQQYIAVSTGFWLADSYTPELVHGRQNTLYVFALPEAGIGHRGPVKPPVNPAAATEILDPAQQGVAFARSVADGVFSAPEAAAGRAVYARACAACHGADFRPAPSAPPVTGNAFLANWRGRSLADLYTLIRTTMPPGAAGTLSEDEHRAALAYILRSNGFPAGEALPDADGMREIGFAE
jgi:mono/diheme cytochrome c family protein